MIITAFVAGLIVAGLIAVYINNGWDGIFTVIAFPGWLLLKLSGAFKNGD